MLPEKLSTDLTSLGEGVERWRSSSRCVVAADGSVKESEVYRAVVKNHAKLAYNARRRLARRDGAAPRRASLRCREWTSSCAPRTASPRRCDASGTSTAR